MREKQRVYLLAMGQKIKISPSCLYAVALQHGCVLQICTGLQKGTTRVCAEWIYFSELQHELHDIKIYISVLKPTDAASSWFV